RDLRGAQAVVLMLCEMRLNHLLFLAGAMLAERAHAEETDHVLQRFRLRGELFRGARELLGARSVPLSDQTHLANGAVNLANTSGLLAGRSCDFLDQIGGLLDGRDQLADRTP